MHIYIYYPTALYSVRCTWNSVPLYSSITMHHSISRPSDNKYCTGDFSVSPPTAQELSHERGGLFPFSYTSQNRQCIERAFRLCVRTWGIFWRPLHVNPPQISSVVSVTMKLHSIRMTRLGITQTGISPQACCPSYSSKMLLADASVNPEFRNDLVACVCR